MAETVEGRGDNIGCILEEEGRGHGSLEGRRVGDAASAVRRQWRIDG
jgi:hypothetical protein